MPVCKRKPSRHSAAFDDLPVQPKHNYNGIAYFLYLRKFQTNACHSCMLLSSDTQKIFFMGMNASLVPAAIPSPWSALHLQTPNFFSVLTFLLAHPFITFGLALFLYFTIPRLWRAFLRFVVLPASIIAAGLVVAKNPQTFANAGSFVSGCKAFPLLRLPTPCSPNSPASSLLSGCNYCWSWLLHPLSQSQAVVLPKDVH